MGEVERQLVPIRISMYLLFASLHRLRLMAAYRLFHFFVFLLRTPIVNFPIEFHGEDNEITYPRKCEHESRSAEPDLIGSEWNANEWSESCRQNEREAAERRSEN